jgi:selenide,water dikinase
LDQVLRMIPRRDDPSVLVGYDTFDDAGVYRLGPTSALVQTIDFFTPIVDDPFTFGAIAAANALSDIYAMGGTPLTALSVLCYPAKGDTDTLAEILRGGASKIHEAGCAVLGGHSVGDDEIKFGYTITGLIDPRRILTNAGARAGDVLFLTKPLGTGVIATALKRNLAEPAWVEAAAESMLTLNRKAIAAAGAAHSATDITGFGLAGHAREMAVASEVTLEISARALPLLAGALESARAGAIPGGLKNNRAFAECDMEIDASIEPALTELLFDPQTSGGLLLALPESEARRFREGTRVGRVLLRQAKSIRIVP